MLRVTRYDSVKLALKQRAGWHEGPALTFVASVAAGLAITITTRYITLHYITLHSLDHVRLNDMRLPRSLWFVDMLC